jgi:ribosome-associated protein
MAKISKKPAVKKAALKKVVSSPARAKKVSSKKNSVPVSSKTRVTPVKKAAAKKAVKPVSNPGKARPKKAGLKVLPKTERKIKALPIIKSPAEILADAAIYGILEKKGKNVICMNLLNVPNAVCDFFIICEAESTRQVAAIADSVDFEVKKATGENPFHSEGWENSLWILLDYVNVVIHVFERETRQFYRLESLWADAEVKEYGVEYV